MVIKISTYGVVDKIRTNECYAWHIAGARYMVVLIFIISAFLYKDRHLKKFFLNSDPEI